MTSQQREQQVFQAIDKGDWDAAIEHATHVHPNWDIWQRLPSAAPMPDHAIHKVLDILTHPYNHHRQNLPSFVFEMVSNLPDHISSETLNHLGNKIVSNLPNSHYEQNAVTKHPNYKPDEEAQSLKNASSFWNEYERKVSPHHFAVIKSFFTNQPEEVVDHRGEKGHSHEHMHLLPDLRNHAKKVQEHILNDENIQKREFRGEKYIKAYRGVNGHYGKIIRSKSNYDPDTNEADKKTFHIPTAHLTSWTTDPEVAKNFALRRGDIENQPHDQGVVMSQWVPIKSILHSGQHRVVPGQDFAHPHESEIVVGHPKGKYRISTGDMKFQDPLGEGPAEGSIENARLRKTEFLSEVISLEEAELGLADDEFMVELTKNSMMKRIVPAATALALLGAPQEDKMDVPSHNMPAQIQQVSEAKPVQTIDRKPATLYAGLNPIKMIESSGGKNTKHKEMESGMHAGTRAYGKFGLMPITILETVNRSPALSNKYSFFHGLDHKEDHDRIHSLMATDPQIEIDLANAHWDRLRGLFGNNKDRMAYAWYNGITGAKRATSEQVRNHPYVQKYHKYKNMLNLEEPVKKNEALIPAIGIKNFIGISDVEQNKKDLRDINMAIASDQLHNLSSVGKFTHDSFVAGFDPDNSWLIKIEPFGERSAIKSAKYGLQVVKEYAFYRAANKVFGLGHFTPKAMLGEVVKDDGKWPSVAIKMYPKVYVSAHDMEESKPGSFKAIMEKHRRTGDLTKMAIMLYVLGDADAHGNNVLTDGYDVKLIDHGTSFANATFDPGTDDGIFVPYILRPWAYDDAASKEENIKRMPEIDTDERRKEVAHWLFNLNAHDLMDILMKLNIDPKPSLMRLKTLQKMVAGPFKNRPDLAINHLWIYGNGAKNESH